MYIMQHCAVLMSIGVVALCSGYSGSHHLRIQRYGTSKVWGQLHKLQVYDNNIRNGSKLKNQIDRGVVRMTSEQTHHQPNLVGKVERRPTNHLRRMAKLYMQQALNPSYLPLGLDKSHRRRKPLQQKRAW